MPSALKLPGLMRMHEAHHNAILCKEYGIMLFTWPSMQQAQGPVLCTEYGITLFTWPSIQLATVTMSSAGLHMLRHARA